MTRQTAVGASFKAVKEPLKFELAPWPNPIRGGMTTLELIQFGFDPAKLGTECHLDLSSLLAVVLEVSCPSFRIREKLWSCDFYADDANWMKSSVTFQLPSDMIRAGCILELQVVVIDPIPLEGSRAACSIPGGLLARGFYEFEPKSGGSLFPIRPMREPSLWSFRFAISEVQDLEKAIGAAFRLNVDTEHFIQLLDPEHASEGTRSRAQELLMVEALTTAVIAVLSDREIAEVFQSLLQSTEPPEKTLNPRSAQFFLLGLMRRLPDDPIPMMNQLQTRPVETVATIRGAMAELVAKAV